MIRQTSASTLSEAWHYNDKEASQSRAANLEPHSS